MEKNLLTLFKKYNIVWDNDDVIVPSGTGLVEHFNEHLNKNIKGGHYTQFQELYGIDAVEETRLLDLFAIENKAGALDPVEGISELLKLLYLSGCTHYVCTARPRVTYGKATEEYLIKHFSETISLKRLSMFEGSNEQHYAFDKFPFFESVKGDIFIDDSLHNVKAIAEQCTREVLILFQKTLHNTHVKEEDLPSKVISIPANNQAKHILDEIISFDKQQKKSLIDVEVRTFTD